MTERILGKLWFTAQRCKARIVEPCFGRDSRLVQDLGRAASRIQKLGRFDEVTASVPRESELEEMFRRGHCDSRARRGDLEKVRDSTEIDGDRMESAASRAEKVAAA